MLSKQREEHVQRPWGGGNELCHRSESRPLQWGRVKWGNEVGGEATGLGSTGL